MNKKMCIFDLDGTLNLKDPMLSLDIIKLSKLGYDFIVSTGRSNDYVIDTCRKYKIYPPRFIIADNGGSIYDTSNKCFLRKMPISVSKRIELLNKYLELGGRKEDIRFSNGSNVFVADDKDVKKYYENDTAIYCQKDYIVDEVLKPDSDVIKITFAGSYEQMKRLQDYVKEKGIGCFTDIGATAFPVKSRNNFRMDVTDSQMSKGEGVRFLVDSFGIYDFFCIGNGMNDLSMFKFAIDRGNRVGIVQNYENGHLQEDSQKVIEETIAYARDKGKEEKVFLVKYPASRSVAQIKLDEKSRRGNMPHRKIEHYR